MHAAETVPASASWLIVGVLYSAEASNETNVSAVASYETTIDHDESAQPPVCASPRTVICSPTNAADCGPRSTIPAASSPGCCGVHWSRTSPSERDSTTELLYVRVADTAATSASAQTAQCSRLRSLSPV